MSAPPRTVPRRPALALVAVLWGCALGACDAVVGSGPSSDPVSLFEVTWGAYDRHYASFERRGIDWDAVHDTYADSVTASTPPARLAQMLGGMVASLHDLHASLHTPYGVYGTGPSRPSYLDAAATARLVGPLARSPGGLLWYGRAGDVGYLSAPTFADGAEAQWGTDADAALGALSGVRAVVLDVRGNGGGSSEAAKALAGRFVSAERVYALARVRSGPRHGDLSAPLALRVRPGGGRPFTGPVAVLTDGHTASAAEDFVLMMRTVAGVAVVGDTTAGAASNPLLRELPNGWTFRVPQSVQSTPDGVVYDGVGLPPDRAVTQSPADSERGVDAALEAAIARLNQ